ncbi:MAG: V-type ATP synthase subunit A [Candidatus Schekmanbacteria bacterium]|nr:V-type ATP synthase subunit A [Candidatus Schekmanbacteria bacterium]
MSKSNAVVVGVNGNMVSARFTGNVRMNAVAYIALPAPAGQDVVRLKAEIIRVRGEECDMQVFEDTRGIRIGDPVEITEHLLAIELGPGLLGMVYDGLGNPLEELAQKTGFFLKRGTYLPTLARDRKWHFKPCAHVGDKLQAGHGLGTVPEGVFTHRIMVPFGLVGAGEVLEVAPAGEYPVDHPIGKVRSLATGRTHEVSMMQIWPVKKPITAYAERLLPSRPLTTRIRIVDTFFPVAEGGTACIPGPFGSGKTVFQQSVSRYADADVVIVAACGERAGEVVETLREFPELVDPRTGRSLMERTIIICNTSSMPVAAREASVYTAVTMAEYYRQMGLRVLVLADSTSRWAQALREMSGRLEEIPGEEAFPAYLGSLIAAFYERGGIVRLADPNLGAAQGSTTIIGTVSPAGGNFEEPVTQSTLAVVGCFLGLTYARSYAKRFPAISPLDSWSKYLDSLKPALEELYAPGWVAEVRALQRFYREGQRIGDQMKVVGEEELSVDELVHFLKSELFDAVFLQQNAYDEVDAGPSTVRTAFALKLARSVLEHDFGFVSKDQARERLLDLTSAMRNWNLAADGSPEYERFLSEIRGALLPRDGAGRKNSPSNVSTARKIQS